MDASGEALATNEIAPLRDEILMRISVRSIIDVTFHDAN